MNAVRGALQRAANNAGRAARNPAAERHVQLILAIIADAEAALAFLDEHPEAFDEPPVPPEGRPDFAVPADVQVRNSGPSNVLSHLATAFDRLAEARGGDLDGYRERIYGGITLVAAELQTYIRDQETLRAIAESNPVSIESAR